MTRMVDFVVDFHTVENERYALLTEVIEGVIKSENEGENESGDLLFSHDHSEIYPLQKMNSKVEM